MTTNNKDFKVKNGLAVNGNGAFGGPVVVGTPTDPDHAVTKEYIDSVAGIGGLDGGTPTTEVYSGTFDGGSP